MAETLCIYPDWYEDCEDLEDNEWMWDDFIDELNMHLEQHNEYTDSKCYYYWKVIGHHMGWLKLEGYKFVKAKNAQELLREILPDSDCTIKVLEDKGNICLSVGHHDGHDYYELIPSNLEEYGW